MRRRLIPVILLLALPAGCDGGSPDVPAPSTAAGSTSASGTPASTATATPSTGPDSAPASPSTRTAYDWGVPSEPARISHRDRPPPPPPPAPQLPYLVRIEATDHPDAEPGYSRISFTFRGGFPSYHLEYVPAVRVEGSGEAIPLPGNAFLRVRFIQAQAHDARGVWTVTATPRPELDFRTLRGYGFAGDFEGYLCYGLGIQVPADSDHAIPVRAIEATHSDGRYVISVDVRHP